MRIRTEGVEKYEDKYQLSFYYLFIFNSFTNFLSQSSSNLNQNKALQHYGVELNKILQYFNRFRYQSKIP